MKNRQLPAGWRSVRLGDLLMLRKEVVHPCDNPHGASRFVGLEHVESTTGRRIGSVDVEMSQLTGRKPCFHTGDIVYGYLRPYLNKVWIAEFDGLCSVDQYVYEVNRDLADNEFIAWFMRSQIYLGRAPIHTTPGQLPRIRTEEVASVALELPPIDVQQRIAGRVREQFSEVARARAAVEAQRNTYDLLVHALLRDSLASAGCQRTLLNDCLREVTEGIGERWAEFPVLGATRAGLALAKEAVGKKPGRYKPVARGTIFYNPMRILLGSIAMIDDDDKPGITSPDYVAVRGVEGKLHPRWFYHWFRSAYGAEFIKSLTRGAVRERLMFKRLAPAQISVPDWPTQLGVAAKLREIKRAKVLLEQRLAEIERLPAALLREAFRDSNN